MFLPYFEAKILSLVSSQADSNSPVWQQMNANYSGGYSYAKSGKKATAAGVNDVFLYRCST